MGVDGREITRLLRSIDGRLAGIAKESSKPSSIRLDPHRSYSRSEAARLLGVSTWTIDKARKLGLLKETARLGQRDVRLSGESLLVFQHERQEQRRAAEVLRV